jgi:hypothetical protein
MHVCEILYDKPFRKGEGPLLDFEGRIHFQNVFIYIFTFSKGKQRGKIGLYMYFTGEVDITTSYLENILKTRNTG